MTAGSSMLAGPHVAREAERTIALPMTPTRIAEFVVDEGTRMNVDISPDGETVFFDLLGDLSFVQSITNFDNL